MEIPTMDPDLPTVMDPQGSRFDLGMQHTHHEYPWVLRGYALWTGFKIMQTAGREGGEKQMWHRLYCKGPVS